MKIPKGYATPDWLSIKPTENGSYQVMSDPMVKEMLDVVVIRLPNYDQHKLKLFNQKEPQTLIHGDLHQGNHLCGTGANEGKVIALDFQIFGKGLVSVELIYLMDLMGLHKNYEEHEEFLRGRIIFIISRIFIIIHPYLKISFHHPGSSLFMF